MTPGDVLLLALVVAVLIGAPLLFIWLIADGLRNGRVRVQQTAYVRAQEPVLYWLSLGTYGVWVGMLLCLDVFFLIEFIKS